MKQEQKGITIKKEENMSEWYEQVCLKSELAEFSTVKGCMVIRPNGYAVWQAIQDYFNKNIIKKFEVKNNLPVLFYFDKLLKSLKKKQKGIRLEVMRGEELVNE